MFATRPVVRLRSLIAALALVGPAVGGSCFAAPPADVTLPQTYATATSTLAAGATWASGQEAWLRIPSVGMRRAVYTGGQPTIDRGVVTHYVGPGLPRTAPGGVGVYWLAGHNGSHGSPFALLPRVAVGASVHLGLRNGQTVTYRITRRLVVGTRISASTLYAGSGARIVLQTCLSSTQRLLVFGQRVA